MNRTLSFLLGLLLLLVLFCSLVVVNNQLLHKVRVDLTENKVYSLSAGSKQVVAAIEEPLNLYFFFSDTTTKGMTGLRNYANRVQSLLEEYASISEGKIRLHIIDPEPFSEAEDQAAQFGLTGAALGQLDESVYFGLAGTNSLDGQALIGFFEPQKEAFLEYDISKLLFQLSQPNAVNITVLTDMPVSGGQNTMTGQFAPPMAFYNQLEQLYAVQKIDSSATEIPDATDVLIIAHPRNLTEALLQSIDQYAMGGGRLMLFVDPHFESDQMAMMGGVGANASQFPLLSDWGIELNLEQILLDANLGLEVRTPQGGVTRHLGIVGFNQASLDESDVVTANLESINAASVGSIELNPEAELSFQPLVVSSGNNQLIQSSLYTLSQDPADLARDFESDADEHVVMARITGTARSAFTQGEDSDWLSKTDNLSLILVADADLLTDRFWVQQSNFFGQTIYTPFADNGDLVNNTVENLTGSDALISIRSRGTFSRPFERVQALEVDAEAKFREQEEILQQRLAETETQLAQLQSQQGDTGALVVTPEQQAAIDQFVEQRIAIRKELRDVRYQLERDIDALGNILKVVNIAVAPLVLSFLLFGLAKLFRPRASRSLKSKVSV